jgi:glutamate-5-semialdehyde dehydrogenase
MAFEPYDPENLLLLSTDRHRQNVKINDPWIDVFIWKDQIYIGSKADIWEILSDERPEIEKRAPLSLLALAGGVSQELAASFGPVVFEWLKGRFGIAVASEWRLHNYFRGIAARRLRSRLRGRVADGVLRHTLQDVRVIQDGPNLVIRMPIEIVEPVGIKLAGFDDLRCAAQAFGFNVLSIEAVGGRGTYTPLDTSHPRSVGTRNYSPSAQQSPVLGPTRMASGGEPHARGDIEASLVAKDTRLTDEADLLPDQANMMAKLGLDAREAATTLALASAAAKTQGLQAAAMEIRARSDAILTANAEDLKEAERVGASAALRDRLALDPRRLEALTRGLERVARLPDPIGQVRASWTRPNGLHIERICVPLGVIGIIYESRPNVTTDAGGIAIKSGNVVILRGGSESFHSSRALVEALREGLRAAGLPANAIQLVPTRDRAAVGLMLGMSGAIDVLMPRGGRSLIERVQRESRIPIIASLEGMCHIFIDAAADPAKARAIVLNSKMRRVSVSNATETLLMDRAVAAAQLPGILADLRAVGCELRGDAETCALDSAVLSAIEEDWSTEYLDAILSVRIVDGVGGAIDHIRRYGSHIDAIVTEDSATAERFLREVDSVIVLVNSSTQFATGGEFGIGPEIVISTQRLPPRGPIGVDELTSYKYVVRGTGQVRP